LASALMVLSAFVPASSSTTSTFTPLLPDLLAVTINAAERAINFRPLLRQAQAAPADIYLPPE
jgi:hypothetical protein